MTQELDKIRNFLEKSNDSKTLNKHIKKSIKSLIEEIKGFEADTEKRLFNVPSILDVKNILSDATDINWNAKSISLKQYATLIGMDVSEAKEEFSDYQQNIFYLFTKNSSSSGKYDTIEVIFEFHDEKCSMTDVSDSMVNSSKISLDSFKDSVSSYFNPDYKPKKKLKMK